MSLRAEAEVLVCGVPALSASLSGRTDRLFRLTEDNESYLWLEQTCRYDRNNRAADSGKDRSDNLFQPAPVS